MRLHRECEEARADAVVDVRGHWFFSCFGAAALPGPLFGRFGWEELTACKIARSSGASTSASPSSSPKARAHDPTIVAIARGSPAMAMLSSVLIIARCLVTSMVLLPSLMEMTSPSSSRRSVLKLRAPLGRPDGFPLCPGRN